MTANIDDPRLARSQKRFDELNAIIAWAKVERDSLICRLYDANPDLCSQRVLAAMNGLSQPGVSGIIKRGKTA